MRNSGAKDLRPYRESGCNPHEREVAIPDFGPAGGPESSVVGDGSCLVAQRLPVCPPQMGWRHLPEAGMMAGGDGHTQFVNQLLVAAGR